MKAVTFCWVMFQCANTVARAILRAADRDYDEDDQLPWDGHVVSEIRGLESPVEKL